MKPMELMELMKPVEDSSEKPKIVSGLSGLSRFRFIFVRFICLIR